VLHYTRNPEKETSMFKKLTLAAATLYCRWALKPQASTLLT
jgi:hypothetical protein